VTAGFHNLTHKHADELSFELYESGQRIVTDTGLYHKDPGAEREFVVSPAAHSTLTVDGRGWPIGDSRRDYGSGLVAVGRGAGWRAIEARNPLLRRQGARHSRLLLYRPGHALLVVDTVRARQRHRYDRYLQLGPRIEVDRRGSARLGLRAPGLRGAVADDTGGAHRVELRGERRPLAGFTSPGFRELVPRWTLRFTTRERDASHALAIGLDGRPWRGEVVRTRPSQALLRIRAGAAPRWLRVERSGRRLAVTWLPAEGP